MSKRNEILGFSRIKNKVKRNAFDLSRRHMFTAQAGEILPIFYQWCNPNETFKLGYNAKTRTASLNTDAFTRIRENVQYYFVPFQSLWKYFEQSVNNMTVGDAGQNISKFAKSVTEADTISTSMPYINYSNLKDVLGIFYAVALDALDSYFNQYRPESKKSLRSATDFRDFCYRSSPTTGFRSVFVCDGYRLCRAAKLLTSLGYGNFSVVCQYDIFAMAMKYITDKGSWNKQAFSQNNNYSLNLLVYDAMSITNSPNLSIFPLLAYHKIINDHYRNEKWQPFEPWTCNIDYLTPGSNMSYNGWGSPAALEKDNTTLFDLENCNLPMDYFTGVLPRAQYGDESAVNVSLDNPFNKTLGVSNPIYSSADSNKMSFIRNVGSSTIDANHNMFARPAESLGVDQIDALLPSMETGEPIRGHGLRVETQHSHSISPASLNAVFNGNAQLKISALRSATAIQKYKEIQNSNDPDYASQVLAHFGIKPHCDSRTSQFIGGDDKTISINPQVNTNLTGDSEPQIKAIGVGDLSAGCKFTSTTYGMIIGLYRAVPQLDYAQIGIDRNLYKTDASDFPIPELDSVGMQTQYRSELAAPQIGVCFGVGSPVDTDSKVTVANDMSATYGYAARYAELKTSFDSYEGGFFGAYKSWVTGYDDNFLFNWRTQFKEASDNMYHNIQDLFKCRPQILYPIFVNQWSGTVNDDKFLVGSVNTCVAVRPFSVHGLPYSK